jgi:hypothetical protein
MNLNNIVLIIIGVIALGLSLLCIGGLGFMMFFPILFPRTPENLNQIKEMINIAGLSGVFSVTAIGFGIYNWHR